MMKMIRVLTLLVAMAATCRGAGDAPDPQTLLPSLARAPQHNREVLAKSRTKKEWLAAGDAMVTKRDYKAAEYAYQNVLLVGMDDAPLHLDAEETRAIRLWRELRENHPEAFPKPDPRMGIRWKWDGPVTPLIKQPDRGAQPSASHGSGTAGAEPGQ